MASPKPGSSEANKPWASAAALAGAAYACLAGVLRGLHPETILMRSLVTAAVTGLAVWCWLKAARISGQFL